MTDWKPDLYLRFEEERTQPAIDLASKAPLSSPRRMLDIGCGPGNSTLILKNRWSRAEAVGLDSSTSMIEKARRDYRHIEWIQADAAGDLTRLGLFDLVFSNAAIQWMPDHHLLLPGWFELLSCGGVLAVQVPFVKQMPLHTELLRLVSSAKWNPFFTELRGEYSMHDAAYYYDILSCLTNDLELWRTDYFHVMNHHTDIVDWYRGAGLRPYLECLPDDVRREAFLGDFCDALRDAYPLRDNGKILFPFTRMFFIAVKKG